MQDACSSACCRQTALLTGTTRLCLLSSAVNHRLIPACTRFRAVPAAPSLAPRVLPPLCRGDAGRARRELIEIRTAEHVQQVLLRRDAGMLVSTL